MAQAMFLTMVLLGLLVFLAGLIVGKFTKECGFITFIGLFYGTFGLVGFMGYYLYTWLFTLFGAS